MYTIAIERHTQLDNSLLQTIIELAKQIPEFENRYQVEDIQQRLQDRPMLLQFIRVEGELVGFKVGYSEQQGQFYSWLGAVLPEFRQLGLATQLLADQEAWAKANGFNQMQVKTYNRFAAMLQMLIQQGYKIAGLQKEGETINDNKLFLNKVLN
ncbi:GNAT family N-acetyltransferase [Shewanella sp. Isolate11]|uniref:GNAT family N-acetyltransferase n=1 Tax=Shewanella sp. Isolate11 TaxID=2908530 RepID=UPI001EFD9610|nr:GNAT family N-acetyltransferase [Shewanella sp. Isolate11]MCG9697957.1 GNAT family N-acetyltransferase [Shewanella sp. Isolate11]